MSGTEMLDFYSKDLNLKPYVKILEGKELIPLIMDSKDNILSMPPIINSDISKIDLNTKNIFIDITATDLTKAHIALNIICSNFSIYSETKCHFEQVEVITDGEPSLCPKSELYKHMTVKKSYLERVAGVKIEDKQVTEGFEKMGLAVEKTEGDSFKVEIPFYRSDIMHQCDLAEDLTIAIGFNNLPYTQADV